MVLVFGLLWLGAAACGPSLVLRPPPLTAWWRFTALRGPSPELHLRQGSILCGVAPHSWWPGRFCPFGDLQLYSVSAFYYSLGVTLDTTLPCRAASCYCCRPVATASFTGSAGWMIYRYLFNVTVPSNSILCRLWMASLGSDVFFTWGTLGLRFLQDILPLQP